MSDGKQAQQNGVTYADAGVDISAGNALVEAIKPLAKATRRKGTARTTRRPDREPKRDRDAHSRGDIDPARVQIVLIDEERHREDERE